MGDCVSTSSKSMCSSCSSGDEPVPRPYLGIGCCVPRERLPDRIITSGKSRSSCIFTQQGHSVLTRTPWLCGKRVLPFLTLSLLSVSSCIKRGFVLAFVGFYVWGCDLMCCIRWSCSFRSSCCLSERYIACEVAVFLSCPRVDATET